MKRLILYLVLVGLLLVRPLFGTDFFVSHETGASDNEGDGTTGSPYRTLQKAFDVAGAGDVVKLKNDANGTTSQADYVFNMELTNLPGTWSTTFHGFQPDVDQGWSNNDHDQKVMYLKDDVDLDIYGYVIDATTTTSRGFLRCTAGEVLGREPDNADTLTLIGVGDQYAAVPITTGGDLATNSWMEITSAQETQSVIDLDNIEVVRESVEGAIEVRADMVKISNLEFTDSATPGDRNYGILSNDTDVATTVHTGAWVTDCTFTNVSTGVHLSPLDSDDVRHEMCIIENNTAQMNDFGSHSTMFFIANGSGTIRYNVITGYVSSHNVSANNIIIGINLGSGSIYGNEIRDVPIADILSGYFAAIGCTDSKISEIRNNVIFNVTHEETETLAGAIYLGGGTVCDAMYNNIIMSCTYGFNSGSNVGYSAFTEYNCIYDTDNDYTGTGIVNNGNNITSDPKFKDATSGDFRLRNSSPCLNTGKPTLNSGFSDMGAWQRQSGITRNNWNSRSRNR